MKNTLLKFLVWIISTGTFQTALSQSGSIKSFTQDFEKKEGFINYYWDDNKGKVYYFYFSKVV